MNIVTGSANKMRNLFLVSSRCMFVESGEHKLFQAHDKRGTRTCGCPDEDIQLVDQEVKHGGSTKGSPYFSRPFYSIAIMVFISPPLNTLSHRFQSKCYQSRGHPTKSNKTQLWRLGNISCSYCFLSIRVNYTLKGWH